MGILNKKSRLTAITFGLLLTTSVLANEGRAPLTIEMTDPQVRITIPSMPEIEMAVHPKNEETPIFRLRGSTEETSISVITAQIDEPITPMACATAIANMVLAQDGVTREQMFLGRSNENTFLIIYGVPLEQSVLLNTHIVSADAPTMCIEAHVSQISTSDADVESWYNGFGDSNIEKF